MEDTEEEEEAEEEEVMIEEMTEVTEEVDAVVTGDIYMFIVSKQNCCT